PEGRPHLLSVQHEVIAVECGGGLERCEVAAGPRLAEALAPDLVAGEHRWNEPPALRFAAVVDQGWSEQPDAEDVQDRRGGRGPPARPRRSLSPPRWRRDHPTRRASPYRGSRPGRACAARRAAARRANPRWPPGRAALHARDDAGSCGATCAARPGRRAPP